MSDDTITTILISVLTIVGSATAMWMYILWLEQEQAKTPEDRNPVARALIGTWETIRSGVEWVFSKVGIISR